MVALCGMIEQVEREDMHNSCMLGRRQKKGAES